MVVAEFDQIADIYDETRRPLNEETVSGIREMLTKYRCRSVLEIGVGTGRVALPLKESGFEINGIDISIRMMEKAKAKGIENLVLASGDKLPFKEKSFDATIMAHVFHIIQDPRSVLREAARVSRSGVFALVRKGNFRTERWYAFFGGAEGSSSSQNVLLASPSSPIEDGDETLRKYYEERRQRFIEIAKKYGWTPNQQRTRNWGREKEILDAFPPDDLKPLKDVVVNESLEDRIARLEKGAYSFMSSMPEEMRKELVQEMRAGAASMPERALRSRHEAYQIAMWKPERFASA